MLLSRWSVPLLVPRPVCGQTHRGPPASGLKGSRTTLIACVRPTRHPVTSPARRQSDGRAPSRRLGAMHGNGGYGNPGEAFLETPVDTRVPPSGRVSRGVRYLPVLRGRHARDPLDLRNPRTELPAAPDADRIATSVREQDDAGRVRDSANGAPVSPPSPLADRSRASAWLQLARSELT